MVCVDRDEAAVEETWRLITEEGGKAAIVVADVTTEEGCRLAVSDEPGLAPDGLVLNVGTGFGMGVAGTSIDDWDKTFDLNLRAHFLLVRRALVTLSDNGSIVFVGSVAGLRPGSRIPAYDASKAGLIGLSRHVAVEGARRGIRANVLAPGLIDTPLGRAASAGRPSRTRSPVPLGRQGTALGGGGGGRLPPLGRGELRHRAGPGRRRGADAGMSAHSGAAPVGSARGPAPAPPRPACGALQPRRDEQGRRPRGGLGSRARHRHPRRPAHPHRVPHAGQRLPHQGRVPLRPDLRPGCGVGAQRAGPRRRAADHPRRRSTSSPSPSS